MAAFIASAMGQSVTQQLTAWGTGIVTELQIAGLVAHTSGKVTGTVPPVGGPLLNGAAADGEILGIDGSSMASLIQAGAPLVYPTITSELENFCGVVADHIKDNALVEFASGDITGICTNTIITPGTLAGGEGANGIVTTGSMNGSDMADEAISAVPFTPPPATSELIDFCTAIIDYIEANALITYASGSITGTCSAGGGALIAGAGSGGTIL